MREKDEARVKHTLSLSLSKTLKSSKALSPHSVSVSVFCLCLCHVTPLFLSLPVFLSSPIRNSANADVGITEALPAHVTRTPAFWDALAADSVNW